MTHSAKRILSIGCVILLLSGTVSSCKKRNTGNSRDASAVAEQQIRNTLDDFFAYIKVAKTDKISARSDDPAPLEEYLREVTETSGTKPFETSCRRVDAEVVSVTSSGEEGSAEVKVSYADPQTIKEKAALAGGFADIGKLSESISTAPVVTKEFKLDMHHVDGSWKITSRSTRPEHKGNSGSAFRVSDGNGSDRRDPGDNDGIGNDEHLCFRCILGE